MADEETRNNKYKLVDAIPMVGYHANFQRNKITDEDMPSFVRFENLGDVGFFVYQAVSSVVVITGILIGVSKGIEALVN